MFKYFDGGGNELTYKEAFTCQDCGRKVDNWIRSPWRTAEGVTFCELDIAHSECGFVRSLQIVKEEESITAWQTDNGRPCPRCGGTCYSYSPVAGNSGKWQADCYGCSLKHYFKHPDVARNKYGGYDCTAADVSAAHRAVKAIEVC